MTDFLARLKQRKLVQWALAYIAAAFALIQVIDVVASKFTWPGSLERSIILALAVGFVVALVIAWYHGEKGRQRVSGPELLLIALVLAIGGGLLWRFGRPASSPVVVARMARSYNDAVCRSGPCPRAAAEMQARSPALPALTPAASVAAIPVKSVAVLPLVNESGDKGQQYFSDGLSEDLINALSQFAGLKVINRDSSFQFRHSKDSMQEIGEKLGVAHLLEGSVQRAGDEVRVSAELVNVSDGSTLWSQQYDRPYKDLFALQDTITKAVADALKARLLDTGNGVVVQSDLPPSGNLAAYNAYLKGQAAYQRFSETSSREAIEQFSEAAQLDPNYAAAYAAAGRAWIEVAAFELGGDAERQGYAKARADIDRALQLNPNFAAAHDARGLLLQWVDFDWRGAEGEYRRALQLAPSDSQAKFGLALNLSTFGHPRQAIALLQQVLATDPHGGDAHYYLGWNLAAIGDFAQAERAQRRSLRWQPGAMNAHEGLATILVMRGDAEAALSAARQESDPASRDFAVAMALQAEGDRPEADAALKTLIDKDADVVAYQIAEVYAFRRDPDNVFKWLDRAWANRDPGIGLLLTDPFILRYQHDLRFAVFCKKVGLPTTTDAKALP